MPEFIALDKIFNTKNCPVQDIGLALGFTKSGATRIVNRLEKKGYVQKKDPMMMQEFAVLSSRDPVKKSSILPMPIILKNLKNCFRSCRKS